MIFQNLEGELKMVLHKLVEKGLSPEKIVGFTFKKGFILKPKQKAMIKAGRETLFTCVWDWLLNKQFSENKLEVN